MSTFPSEDTSTMFALARAVTVLCMNFYGLQNWGSVFKLEPAGPLLLEVVMLCNMGSPLRVLV